VARVVCAHGAGQQRRGGQVLHGVCAPALRSGVALAGADVAAEYVAAAWWAEAARVAPRVVRPVARTPQDARVALRALGVSRFFAGLAEWVLVFDLKQVHRYLTKAEARAAARRRVADTIRAEIPVVVHSLRSVVAYEALCANLDWLVRRLVMLESPLGIRHLKFDRLDTMPTVVGTARRGMWPGTHRSWVNVADAGDVTTLGKDLRPAFGHGVSGWLANNGATAHDVVPYLTAVETGKAIADALAS
jgi:hypothetical protein